MSKIEWCDKSWNPIKMRCTPVSEGCQNCYAARKLARKLPYDACYPKPGESPILIKDVLNEPLHWKKPRKIFVESMGDLGHEDVADADMHKVLSMADLAPQHTYIILTKRIECFLVFLTGWYGHFHIGKNGQLRSNIWLGVTAENQRTADERIPILLQIPAAVRFVSVEPMLGLVVLGKYLRGSLGWKRGTPGLDWVICGAETGPKARPIDKGSVYVLMDDCKDVNVPFFFKKWGTGRDGVDMPREWPDPAQMSVF